MKLPQISINTVVTAVFVIAVDCAVIRSISLRPTVFLDRPIWMVLGALPMANIMAVLVSIMLQGRRKASPFLLGFITYGLTSLFDTVLCMNSARSLLFTILEIIRIDTWVPADFQAETIIKCIVVPAYFLVFQIITALVGGWIIHTVVIHAGAAAAVVNPPRRRFRFAALLTLILVATPALLTETYLYLYVDPMSVRYRVGSEAVIDTSLFGGYKVAHSDGSSFQVPNGTIVRIDDDSEELFIEITANSDGDEYSDLRPVRVTLLGGEHDGESILVPKLFLRAGPKQPIGNVK